MTAVNLEEGSEDRLDEILKQIDQQSNPPVHLWKPDYVGEIDIRIDAQGYWYHEGSIIGREELVNLFATIVWYENGQHYLVTPVEKLAITVEDVPFLIHQMEQVGDGWVATSNTHQQIIINQDHPVELRQFQGQWIPYINLRYQLWGRVNRSVFYQWVQAAMDEQADESQKLQLISQGYTFEVARA